MKLNEIYAVVKAQKFYITNNFSDTFLFRWQQTYQKFYGSSLFKQANLNKTNKQNKLVSRS